MTEDRRWAPPNPPPPQTAPWPHPQLPPPQLQPPQLPPPVLPDRSRGATLARPLLVVAVWHVVLAIALVVGASYVGVQGQASDCASCPSGPLATILLILVIGPWLVPMLLISTGAVWAFGLARRWLPWLPMAAALVIPPTLAALLVSSYV